MVQLSPFIICNNQGSARYLIFWHETPDCGRQFFLFQFFIVGYIEGRSICSFFIIACFDEAYFIYVTTHYITVRTEPEI